ncbi:hypothetical protein GCM10010274_24100 [Streptomyces lavendofoliae]|uniref:Uncharacterized protein n=1 Tax=Streptomyces lavendofoliae TaxID=67314 RepID=A0A918M485_9ACTN|nr:hypothetical protein GCM10010274_24100 [Streptomyces lavendofoliae]
MARVRAPSERWAAGGAPSGWAPWRRAGPDIRTASGWACRDRVAAPAAPDPGAAGRGGRVGGRFGAPAVESPAIVGSSGGTAGRDAGDV